MRYVHALLCLLMLLFIAVQYNDPDGPLWIAIYLVPATWTALAAIRPAWFGETPVQCLLLLCLALAMAGTLWFWPVTPDWWMTRVWYETEEAREGMGMMIVTGVLLVVVLLPGRTVAETSG